MIFTPSLGFAGEIRREMAIPVVGIMGIIQFLSCKYCDESFAFTFVKYRSLSFGNQ